VLSYTKREELVMGRKYDEIKNAVLKDVAEFMCAMGRTAPKTRGRDNLVITILDGPEKKKIIQKMKQIAKRDSRPSCERDAKSIAASDFIVVFGTKKETLGLNCGFCGYSNCEKLAKTKGVCAYNSVDLGIALGSAASLAGRFHVDNRLMYSIGKAAIECGVLGKRVIQAIGIPLSATGKNPFFDRK
jgi:uncharacterized ferredoxin-like protein